MELKKQLAGVACMLLAAGMFVVPSDSEAGRYGRGYGQQRGISTGIASLPLQDLSAVEELGLVKMREEEKMARDVYLFLYAKWNQPVFQNISQSEERHMAAVKIILDRYDMLDPAAGAPAGVFSDPELQEFYASLTEQGEVSLTEALLAGALIEDMDIYDLQTLMEQTDNSDIRLVYENLAKGSRNHLRMFVYQLSILGVEYEPQYLSVEEVQSILSSDMERGPVGRTGGFGRRSQNVRPMMSTGPGCRGGRYCTLVRPAI